MLSLKTLEATPVKRRLIVPIGAVATRPRLLKTLRNIAFATTIMRGIDGNGEGIVAGVDGPGRHLIDKVIATAHIELENLHVVSALCHFL